MHLFCDFLKIIFVLPSLCLSLYVSTYSSFDFGRCARDPGRLLFGIRLQILACASGTTRFGCQRTLIRVSQSYRFRVLSLVLFLNHLTGSRTFPRHESTAKLSTIPPPAHPPQHTTRSTHHCSTTRHTTLPYSPSAPHDIEKVLSFQREENFSSEQHASWPPLWTIPARLGCSPMCLQNTFSMVW